MIYWYIHIVSVTQILAIEGFTLAVMWGGALNGKSNLVTYTLYQRSMEYIKWHYFQTVASCSPSGLVSVQARVVDPNRSINVDYIERRARLTRKRSWIPTTMTATAALVSLTAVRQRSMTIPLVVLGGTTNRQCSSPLIPRSRIRTSSPESEQSACKIRVDGNANV